MPQSAVIDGASAAGSAREREHAVEGHRKGLCGRKRGLRLLRSRQVPATEHHVGKTRVVAAMGVGRQRGHSRFLQSRPQLPYQEVRPGIAEQATASATDPACSVRLVWFQGHAWLVRYWPAEPSSSTWVAASLNQTTAYRTESHSGFLEAPDLESDRHGSVGDHCHRPVWGTQ
jgi:hypothetical protein